MHPRLVEELHRCLRLARLAVSNCERTDFAAVHPWRPKVGCLSAYAVTKKPIDFPNSYVVRRWEDGKATGEYTLSPTLEAARLTIPPGLTVIPHQPGEDPVIVETWI